MKQREPGKFDAPRGEQWASSSEVGEACFRLNHVGMCV